MLLLRAGYRPEAGMTTEIAVAAGCLPDISPAQPGPEHYNWLGVCDRCGLMRYEVWHYDTKRGEICHGTP